MVHKFIKDFKEGELVESVYLVREKSFDTTRNGALYISLELADKTGVVDGRKWDASKDLFDSFNADDFVKIRGRVEVYKGFSQLKLDSLNKVEDSSADISCYIPTVDKDIEQMFISLLSEIENIKNNYLKVLLKNIFLNEKIACKFKKAPAATDFHHPYIGGLLEHTLSCIELAKFISSKYPEVNRDILISGAILHDIGKIEELSYKRSFYYTDKGRLIGHIILGVNMIEIEIGKITDFPEGLKNLILHIVISHHGELEWGAPKRPMCLEAVLLHQIDNMDAKANGFIYFVKTYNNTDSNWTKHSKMFKEFLYKKQEVTYEEEKKDSEEAGKKEKNSSQKG